MADAEAIWLEMAAKYPTEGSAAWVALARYHASEMRYREAAFEARMALYTNSDRRDEMVRLYRFGLDQLEAAEKDKLEAKIRDLSLCSDKAQAAADQCRAAGKKFMTAGAEKLVHSPDLLAVRPAAAPPPKTSRLPESPRPVEADSAPAYVAARIRVATIYLQAGQWDAAERILEDVTRECPKDPQIDEARRLLGELHGR